MCTCGVDARTCAKDQRLDEATHGGGDEGAGPRVNNHVTGITLTIQAGSAGAASVEVEFASWSARRRRRERNDDKHTHTHTHTQRCRDYT